MIPRYACAAGASACVTFALFFLMQYLIHSDLRNDQETIQSEPIEIVRPERETDVRTKRRRPDRAELDEPPPPPPLQVQQSTRPEIDLAGVSVNFDSGVDLAGSGPGAAPSDMNVTPIVRVLPQYPIRAAEREIEGWVLLEFTVTKTGRVNDVSVVDADPRRIFDREAIRAVRKWKYNPKIENGKPVEQHGIQAVISFELPDE